MGALCSGCGAVLPTGARFCIECGVRQGVPACQICGEANPEGARFCASCGAAVGVSPAPVPAPSPNSAPITERRVCSVLFCDLVGITAFSEDRDAEDVRALLSTYFDAAKTVITRYGGVVEKFIGDAVMAVWGTPAAGEGDAERAVRAALDLVDAVVELREANNAPGLAARAGVLTGEVAVAVGAVGQALIAGDAVNTAARVQEAANPGTVLVDEGTWRAARAAVGFTPIGKRALKGKREPVALWRAERVTSGIGGALRVDGLAPAFVGRESESRLVKELFHACAERRSPRLVSVTGVAGVGKSRLAWEFEKYIDGLAASVLWHRGRCPSYGEGVAFSALAEMLRQRFAISQDDSAATLGAKLRAGLHEWLPDDADRAYAGPRIAQLLGADTGEPGPALSREELFAGWRLFFERLAATEPVLLVVEDIDRADDGLLEFLEHLLDWSRDVPIFVLTLGRLELTSRRPGWGVRRNGTALTLEPLDDAAMGELLDALVPELPDAAKRAVAEQAQGVPLYAVETVRMLIDQGAVQQADDGYRLVGDLGDLEVPPTLHSLLAARLDALDAEARALVADLAVLGGSFTVDAISAVSGRDVAQVQPVLNELVDRAIFVVRADPLSPEQGQYGFAQAMFRQVAYRTLSRNDRKRRHLAVADHLQNAYTAGGDEVSEAIARHLLDAVEVAPDDADAPQLWTRALEMLVKAGERADRTGAPGSAIAAYNTAVDLLERRNTSADQLAAARLRERAAESAGAMGDEPRAVEYFRHAAATYRRHDQLRDAARADAGAGEHLRRQGLHDEARRLLSDALTVLQADPDADTVRALEHLAMLEILGGTPEGDVLSSTALTLAEALGMDDASLAHLLITRGIRETRSGWVRASASLREAIRRAEAAQDMRAACRAWANLSEVLCVLDPQGAVDAARSAVACGRRVGDHYMLAYAASGLVEALMLTGDWFDAERVYSTAVEDGFVDDPLVAYAMLQLRAWQGDDAGVAGLLQVVEQWAKSADMQDRACLHTARAVAASSGNDGATVLREASLVLEAVDAIAVLTGRWVWPVAADAALAMDDQRTVADLLRWLNDHPVGHVGPRLRAEKLRVEARLLARAGDAAADDAFDAAIRALRRFGAPHLLATGLLDFAEYCAQAGLTAAAEEYTAEALAIAATLNAQPLLRRAELITSAPMSATLTSRVPAPSR